MTWNPSHAGNKERKWSRGPVRCSIDVWGLVKGEGAPGPPGFQLEHLEEHQSHLLRLGTEQGEKVSRSRTGKEEAVMTSSI